MASQVKNDLLSAGLIPNYESQNRFYIDVIRRVDHKFT